MQTEAPSLPPIASGLFVDDDYASGEPRLRGARNGSTGRIVFPCPDPLPDGLAPMALAREGKLWTFTVQRFRPKSPPYAEAASFAPYAVGYVELPGEVIVESRLVGIPFDDLVIGMPLRLTIETVSGSDGGACLTYAFTKRDDGND